MFSYRELKPRQHT